MNVFKPKRRLAFFLLIGVCMSAGLAKAFADGGRQLGVSLVLESRSSIWRGGRYLLSRQLPDGSWSGNSIVSAYAIMALANSSACEESLWQIAIVRGARFIGQQAHGDGSIWNERTRRYPVYSTAVSLMGLARVDRCGYQDVIANARRYLLASQNMEQSEGNLFHGGFAYAHKLLPDLTTTQWVLEALYVSDYLDRDSLGSAAGAVLKADRAYACAVNFVSRCQQHGPRASQTADKKLRTPSGWFADQPAELAENETREKSPRGIGFLTYAGIKCLVYANVPSSDPRFQEAMTWVGAHYTANQNPGLGTVGQKTSG